MIPTLLAITSALTAPAAGDAVISGNMTWVFGNLASDLTLSGSPQVVSVVKDGVTTNYGSVNVVYQSGTTLPSGTQVVLLAAGSAPFAMAFSTRTVTAYSPNFPLKSIAIDATGKMAGGAMWVLGDQPQLYSNPVSSGQLIFRNGISLTVNEPISSYNFTVSPTNKSIVGTTVFTRPHIHRVNFNIKGGGLNGSALGIGIPLTIKSEGDLTVGTDPAISNDVVQCGFTMGGF